MPWSAWRYSFSSTSYGTVRDAADLQLAGSEMVVAAALKFVAYEVALCLTAICLRDGRLERQPEKWLCMVALAQTILGIAAANVWERVLNERAGSVKYFDRVGPSQMYWGVVTGKSNTAQCGSAH